MFSKLNELADRASELLELRYDFNHEVPYKKHDLGKLYIDSFFVAISMEDIIEQLTEMEEEDLIPIKEATLESYKTARFYPEELAMGFLYDILEEEIWFKGVPQVPYNVTMEERNGDVFAIVQYKLRKPVAITESCSMESKVNNFMVKLQKQNSHLKLAQLLPHPKVIKVIEEDTITVYEMIEKANDEDGKFD
ncbi:hypothetical protein AWH56_018645 [Anaerobacillus isosaccharinicus]|uniref:Uncharacterized protein n=1 Tax=Anaerobacillus isosaccharinicus TaxID=1532552 RepID=A0A1S2M6W0_9BACI|nr:hypothetical protein [Anaerobacillus isosaccharinicus]MBA5587076.1 hypothetical protein [Anaerobacillus isosaccharinicus]QOY34728.1 hypothetical protein AWH56_018645 [Anaerobacillus isosaccharinicus]